MQILALNLYTESQKSHNSYFVWCSYFKREQHSHGMVTSSRIAMLWRQVHTFREGPHLSAQPRVCHVMYLFNHPQSLNKHVLSRLGRKVTWSHMQGHKAFKDVVTCSQYSSIPETGCRREPRAEGGSVNVQIPDRVAPEGGEAAELLQLRF